MAITEERAHPRDPFSTLFTFEMPEKREHI